MPRGGNKFNSGNGKIEELKIPLSKRVKAFFISKRLRMVLAVLVFSFALFLLIAYFSFFINGKEDYSILQLPKQEQRTHIDEITNVLGWPGARLAHILIDRSFGVFSVFIILFLFALSYFILPVNKNKVFFFRFFATCLFILIWGSVSIAFIENITDFESFFQIGGHIGNQIATFLNTYLKITGTLIILIVSVIVFAIIIDPKFIDHSKKIWSSLSHLLSQVKYAGKYNQQGDDSVCGYENAEKDIEIFPIEDNNVSLIIETQENEAPIFEQEKKQKQIEESLEEKPESDVFPTNPDLDIESPIDIDVVDEAKQLIHELGPYDPKKDLETYTFPPLDLLKIYDNETMPIIDKEEQQNNANKIVTALRNYGVEIDSIKATVGPTVTLYEVVPKAGVKIAKIQSLEADIMLSLSAVGIRIIAPMPGKGTVGIEVPNENPQVVSMHSVIASKKFQDEQKMRLPVAIGRTITNEVFMFDLAKTPHLLVAGATGQGKSVGLNAIIASLLFKKHPAELKLILVDPKMVEFSIYKPLIYHYLAAMPQQDERDIIITDCQKVIDTLNSLVIEMENRYTLLADANCRNVEDYNEKFTKRQLNPLKEIENIVTHQWVNHKYMPYLVIVIDEYGDFIMQAGKEVERPIQRLAQKARAVGMHMILATQRPDVKIITGTIKANIPTRIAFRTQSVVDSRTVLDAKGADQLIGKGDMLYSGGGNLTRIQCAFIDTPEVESLVHYIEQQQKYEHFYFLPEYVSENNEDDDNHEVDIKHLDTLFVEVARYVVAKQEGSTSRLQRAFEIGYNRAGKLSDQLEATGIVGPNKGPKGREVLIQDSESLERLLEKLKLT